MLNTVWKSLPPGARAYLSILGQMWMAIVGLVLVSVGVCLFLFPLGVIVGGLCAILLDRAIDGDLTKRGRR